MNIENKYKVVADKIITRFVPSSEDETTKWMEHYNSYINCAKVVSNIIDKMEVKTLSNEPTTNLHGSSLVELGLLLHTYYMDDAVEATTYFTELNIELCEVLCGDDKTEMTNTIKIMLNEFSNTIRDKLKNSVTH